MRLDRVVQWAERRAIATGSLDNLVRALLSTLWLMLGFPFVWFVVMALFDGGADSLWYGSALAAVLSIAGYAFTLSLFRRWSR